MRKRLNRSRCSLIRTDSYGPKEPFLEGGVDWRHLANTAERSVSCGDAALTALCRTRAYGPTALYPLPCISLRARRPVAVGGKRRPIRLLSGAVPLYVPTVKLPRTTAYLRRHVPPDTCPLTRKQLLRTLLTGLRYRAGMAGRCLRW